MSDTVESPDVEEVEGSCKYCECTEQNACDGGCTWILVDPPICSQCLHTAHISEDDLKAISDNYVAVIQSLTECAQQNTVLVATLVALVIREGGTIRIRYAELRETNLYRIDSRGDADREEQVIRIMRVDPKTREDVPSKLIVPGRLPLIVP